MKSIVFALLLFICSCSSAIKDTKSIKDNPLSDSIMAAADVRPLANTNRVVLESEDLIGYWVGWFIADISDSTREKLENRNVAYTDRNKINISIDSISGTYVKGHSVVANNNRPFEGQLELKANIYTFRVKEPGDDKHDGDFLFQIAKGDSLIKGYWEAFGKLDIKRRKFSLKKEFYTYDSSLQLESSFMDWEKVKIEQDSFDLDELLKEYGTINNLISTFYDEDTLNISKEQQQVYIGWIKEEFFESERVYSSSQKVFDYNASSQLLTKEMVENLTKADIYILRNSIYARHGYSFKDRKLRQYFDWQDWYIPVRTFIKDEITEIEKANIALLLKYEEHAEEYYDEFGR